MTTSHIFGFVAPVLLVCCKEPDHRSGYLFSPVEPQLSGIEFENTLTLDGELNILNYIYFFNGGGVATGDINNDGLDDLFFTGNQVPNKLYLNKGSLSFTDISESAGIDKEGWSTGVSMADINADGLLDIYVCRSGYQNPEKRKNLLFINQGNLKFIEMAEVYGLDDDGFSTQAAFLDYDLDGDLDVFLLNHKHQASGMNNPVSPKINGTSESTDKLFRNDGLSPQGIPVFTNVSYEAGIRIEGFGLGVGVSDINQDGYPDIFISNDFISNDILYINQRDGTFKDMIGEYIRHSSYNGMGNDLADINNDGYTDILELDMLPANQRRRKLMLNKPNYNLFEFGKKMGIQPQYMRNTFQLNNGMFKGNQLPFSELGQLMGLSATDWSWAGLIADYDMDGYRDVFITNGYLKDMTDLDFIVYRRNQFKFRTARQADSLYLNSVNRLPEVRLQNYFFKNDGKLNFTNTSTIWAPSNPGFSNGAAYSDLDNDGDLDLVVNNINEAATLLENRSDKISTGNKKYLKVSFFCPNRNTLGIGAKVWLYSDSLLQYAENFTTKGFQSSTSPILYFGVANATNADSLRVEWPSGRTKTYYNIPLDGEIQLSFNDAKDSESLNRHSSHTPFYSKSDVIKYKHTEIPYADFDIEPLIPEKFSNNGPALAVGDVNGDGLEDLFVGGSYNNSFQLFLQNIDKSFNISVPGIDLEHEDAGALLFDVDNDGDNDLYVVSGGSEFSTMKPDYYQDRLYLNDGHGNLIRDYDAIPEINTSGSCVVSSDYDGDGDLDLFVGGLITPGSYGKAPRSYLLENKGGHFEDVTSQKLKETNPGMVTSAIWSDVNNDGLYDLILVGKWMPVTIYFNNGDTFSKKVLAGTSGWWNSINGADFDNDGDIDFVLGNMGMNSGFNASEKYPLELYVGDLDQDGRTDPLIAQAFLNDNYSLSYYPLASRDLLAQQMLFIKNKYRNYSLYSNATIDDLISDNRDKNLQKFNITTLKSSILENLGNGQFELIELPKKAQWAPILGTIVSDVNMDGNLDILLTGNFYEYEVGSGQKDALLGLILIGDGKFGFTSLSHNDSGFISDGNARSLVRLNLSGRDLVLSSLNADSLNTFYQYENKGQIFQVPKNKSAAIISLKRNRKRKVEFYRGEGYLSQSSRSVSIPIDAKIEFIN